jgi:hypothetical protein
MNKKTIEFSFDQAGCIQMFCLRRGIVRVGYSMGFKVS